MSIPENNTIIAIDPEPDEIRQNVSEKVIAKLESSTITNTINSDKTETQAQEFTQNIQNSIQNTTQQVVDSSDEQLLGLSTDEQRVLKFINLHNKNDRYFLNWNNIFTLGELYYSNYFGEDYKIYQNKLKLITSKYSNPKKFIFSFDSKNIQVFQNTGTINTNSETQNKLIDSINKPNFFDVESEIQNGYKKISQQRVHLEHTYKFLSQQPYIEPSEKKKFVKLRNNFIKSINAYYTYMYYFNRINNYNMSEKQITLPNIIMTYSELTNQMLPRIDKANIRLSNEIINQKYNNDVAKLELYLNVKQKIQEKQNHPKDKKISDELQKLMKEYLEFDKLYQTKLMNHIESRIKKKTISDMVIFDGQPLPGDGAVVNPTEGLDDTKPSTTDIHNTSVVRQSNINDMDEKERSRKFFFINKARRERGDF